MRILNDNFIYFFLSLALKSNFNLKNIFYLQFLYNYSKTTIYPKNS